MKAQKMLKTKREFIKEIESGQETILLTLNDLFLGMQARTPGAENKEFLENWRGCLLADIGAMFDEIAAAAFYAVSADSKTGTLR